MASTMLHEKCCNTVLQLGAPGLQLNVVIKLGLGSVGYRGRKFTSHG